MGLSMGKSTYIFLQYLQEICPMFLIMPTSFVRNRRAPICAGHMAGVKRRTGKRSEPAQNKNGDCLYIVAIVPEKKLI